MIYNKQGGMCISREGTSILIAALDLLKTKHIDRIMSSKGYIDLTDLELNRIVNLQNDLLEHIKKVT